MTDIVGTFIRERLAYLGMSQAELARRIGVNQGTVNKWVTGQNKPNGLSAKAIRKVLKI